MGGNRGQMLRQSSGRSRIVDQEIYQRVLMMAGRLFAGVRYFFTKYIRAKMNAFFLDPMYEILFRPSNHSGSNSSEGTSLITSEKWATLNMKRCLTSAWLNV